MVINDLQDYWNWYQSRSCMWHPITN